MHSFYKLTLLRDSKLTSNVSLNMPIFFKTKPVYGTLSEPLFEEVRSLTTLRKRFIKASEQLEKPLKEQKYFMPWASYKTLEKNCKQPLKSLKQSIKAIDKQIKDLIDSDKKLKDHYKIVSSVDGIGPVTACQMMVSSNEFTRLKTGKEFACYAGVALFEFSSGSSIRACHKVPHLANKSLKVLCIWLVYRLFK